MTDTRITHEIEANPVAAELARDGDRWVLTMRRLLRHAPERVWPMLTEPDRLARWSPFVPDRTIDATGPATARENPGDPPREAEVLTFDPPHELVHRYGDDVLRWTLVAEDDGTLLDARAHPRRQPAPVVDRLRLAHLSGHARRDRGGRPGRSRGRRRSHGLRLGEAARRLRRAVGALVAQRASHHYYSGCP